MRWMTMPTALAFLYKPQGDRWAFQVNCLVSPVARHAMEMRKFEEELAKREKGASEPDDSEKQ
jgi:hypothetical protein